MTTSRELCLERRKADYPAFVRVLKALPKDRLDYKPDPKARSARQLAFLLASEEAGLLALFEKGSIEWKESEPPAELDEIVALFEKSHAAVNARIEALDDAGWQRKAKFLMGGEAAWEDSLGEFAWGFFLDQVHHRGQLSTYIRPMGGKVPSIYGPSADDPGR